MFFHKYVKKTCHISNTIQLHEQQQQQMVMLTGSTWQTTATTNDDVSLYSIDVLYK